MPYQGIYMSIDQFVRKYGKLGFWIALLFTFTYLVFNDQIFLRFADWATYNVKILAIWFALVYVLFYLFDGFVRSARALRQARG
jgi:Na+-driven multidrug efflux pump